MDFEKLGSFYLGKEYDVAGGQIRDRLLMYDARDLTTHAVCVGMTGSGKTGLCLCLLEEAAIDHVPAIIIDPKGDITNLLLTFPDLLPQDFRPWINVDDARRKQMSEDDFAAQQAEAWQKGLRQWGQDSARIKMLRDSADFAIYTPGSDAGIPVSILQSFAAPKVDWDDEAESIRERIQGMVGALLGLVDVDADPVRSREHILLANLFEHFWRQRQDLDLPKLILAIQNPPIRQLGVFDIDTFFPPKDRFNLAMSLNNIIAAPAFQSWLQGQPLDIAGFLSTPEGKPRHSIFYIAHLSDAERMFFVTMLLNQVISWMRTQPGTTSLRAILYMDEIFGYFPPISNPPSKTPMLTLLKQARAFGLGLVLATQNPVDLDYKGLANAGTWFIGRLQTEQDKARVLDGLESASSQAGQGLDRNELVRILSQLGNRVFLLHNVHAEGPATFQTRWTMSYLRGPLTRSQVRQLKGERIADVTSVLESTAAMRSTPLTAQGESFLTSPPSLPPAVRQVYLPVRKDLHSVLEESAARSGIRPDPQNSFLVYSPGVLGLGRIHFVDRKRNLDERADFSLFAQAEDGGNVLRWDQAQELNLDYRDLIDKPEAEARFDKLPEFLNEAREFSALQDSLIDHLYRSQSATLLFSPVLKLYSAAGESERDFLMRLNQSAREQRDAEVDQLSQRYEKRMEMLEDRLRRAEAALAKKQTDAAARQREIFVSVGETVLGMFMGRRSTRAASSAMSKVRQSTSAKMGMEAAAEDVEALQQEITELQKEMKEQTALISERWDTMLAKLEKVAIAPKRSDIEVDVLAIAWAPHWLVNYQGATGLTHKQVLAAF